MKKTLMGGIGADAKASLFLVIIRYSAPLPSYLLCLGGKTFLGGSKKFAPTPLKMISAPVEINPGHASNFSGFLKDQPFHRDGKHASCYSPLHA